MLRKSNLAVLSAAVLAISKYSAEALEARTFLSVAFGAKVDYGTGTNPRSVAVADFNGDGKVDLAVANWDANNIGVRLNNGDGTFGAKINYGAGGANPICVTAADLNGDGKPDLALANWNSGWGVLFNTGNGVFAAPVSYFAGIHPTSLTAGDFNNDGIADLAVADGGSNTLNVLINTGSGTFAAGVEYPTGANPGSVTTADFDHDGKSDLAVVNRGAYPNFGHTVSVLLNNGDGTFAAKVDYGTGQSPNAVTSADFDGDGTADLAIIDSSAVSVLLNNGNGAFATRVDAGAGSGLNALTSADFNGDGRADLAVAGGISTVSILLNKGNGCFAAKTDYTTGSEPDSVASADFNGDGNPDLAVTNRAGNTVSVLLNHGTAPDVTASTFDSSVRQQQLRITFSTDVSASLSADDLFLQNLSTSKTIPSANISLSYNPSTNTATFIFPGYGSGTLPDGNYRATLPTGSVTNATGTPMPAFSYSFSFFGPAVVSCTFNLNSPQKLLIIFKTDVSASLSVDDLVLDNLTTAESIPGANISLSYNTSTNTATFTFPGYPNGLLPVGNYRATLPTGSVTDAPGNPMAAFSYDFSFFGPAVVSSIFDSIAPQQQLRITFNSDVSNSLSADDLVLQNLSTAQIIATANISLTYILGTNTATFIFPGYARGTLPDGNYCATLPAGSVTDVSGNSLPVYSFDFYFYGPAVLSSTFDSAAPQQQLRITFNTNVSSSLSVDDLLLQNMTTAQTIPAATISLSYNTSTNTATFTFPGYPNGVLPDGNYRATLSPASVTDRSGNPLSPFSYDFVFFFGSSVVSSIFDYNAPQQQLRITFAGDVAASLAAENLVLHNLTTGQNVPTENVILSYNTTTNTARFTFPAYSHGALPDGNYRAAFLPGSITDTSGNPLGAFTFDFFALNGDCNRDRVVNINDLGIVGMTYGTTGKRWNQGDFTYDGVVNILDLGIVGQRYNKSLPPPLQAVAISSAAFTQQTSSLTPPPPPVRSTTRMPVRVVTFIQDI